MRSTQNFIKGFCILLVVCISANSFAWGYAGHRIVVQIAMKVLTSKKIYGRKALSNKEAYAKIQKLVNELYLTPEGLPYKTHLTPDQLASYMDDQRSDPNYDCISCLHFANVPNDPTGKITYEQTVKNPQGDAVEAVMALAQLLKSEGDYTAINEIPAYVQFQKNIGKPIPFAEALVQQEHIVGDTSQPEHLGAQSDFGGNSVEVDVFGTVTKLHPYLDKIMGVMVQGRNIEELTDDIFKMLRDEDWDIFMKQTFAESIDRTIALRPSFFQFDGTRPASIPKTDTVDGVVPPVPAPPTPPGPPAAPETIGIVGDAYIKRNLPILLKQLASAGIMLARIWEQELSSKSSTPKVFKMEKKQAKIGQCEASFM